MVSAPIVRINTALITDWDLFHEVFSKAFGFPDFYGRNMDAWIDCMSSLDDPDAGMTTVHAPPGGVVVLSLEGMTEFAGRCPEIYNALIECAAFVNFRNLQVGGQAVLALSFYK